MESKLEKGKERKKKNVIGSDTQNVERLNEDPREKKSNVQVADRNDKQSEHKAETAKCLELCAEFQSTFI